MRADLEVNCWDLSGYESIRNALEIGGWGRSWHTPGFSSAPFGIVLWRLNLPIKQRKLISHKRPPTNSQGAWYRLVQYHPILHVTISVFVTVREGWRNTILLRFLSFTLLENTIEEVRESAFAILPLETINSKFLEWCRIPGRCLLSIHKFTSNMSGVGVYGEAVQHECV